jgi:hypothetical protein
VLIFVARDSGVRYILCVVGDAQPDRREGRRLHWKERNMIIVAKFASICPTCSQRIAVGEKVEWSKGSKAAHVACGAGGVSQRSSYRGPYRGSRRNSRAGSAPQVAGYSSWCTGRDGCGCFDCAS